ncbi:MAG: hypothetical protein QM784_17145 [Polyangiaceae bacterium]
MLVTLGWLFGSPAGKVVASLGSSSSANEAPASYQAFGAALRALPDFMLDIASSDEDDTRLVLWVTLVLVLLVLTVVARQETDLDSVVAGSKTKGAEAEDEAESALTLPRLVVGMIVPASFLAYVTFPTAHGFIWPISQRFPLIGALFLVPLLGRPAAWVRALTVGCAILLSARGTVEYSELFRDIEARAYRGFDDTISRIPRGSRVATLVFDRNLEGLRLSPLMHAAGWVQADSGRAGHVHLCRVSVLTVQLPRESSPSASSTTMGMGSRARPARSGLGLVRLRSRSRLGRQSSVVPSVSKDLRGGSLVPVAKGGHFTRATVNCAIRLAPSPNSVMATSAAAGCHRLRCRTRRNFQKSAE